MEELSMNINLEQYIVDGNLPIQMDDSFNTNTYSKFSLNDISAFGLGFKAISDAFKQTSSATNELYQVIIPDGGHLAAFKDGSGYLGTVLNDSTNKLMAQARLVPAAPVENAIQFNPVLIAVAIGIKSIDMKLNTIIKNTNTIIHMIDAKTQADLIGNYKFLIDILKEYKYNWDNQLFIDTNHTKIMDLKQESIKSIEYSRTRIKKEIKDAKKLLHGDKYVDSKINYISQLFANYQIALYMFYLTTYLNTILLKNYDKGYLEKVIEDLEDYSYNYLNLYSKTYESLEKISKGSIPSYGVKMVSKTIHAMGDVTEKIPLVSKGSFDEKMKYYGKKTSSNYISHRQKAFKSLRKRHNNLMLPFKESINQLDMINNRPVIMLFDDKNVYLKEKVI